MTESPRSGMRVRPTPRRLAAAGVVTLTLAVSVAHYLTPPTHPLLHNIFQRLYYLPLLLACASFGVRGGLLTAAVIAVLYTPHILLHWGHGGWVHLFSKQPVRSVEDLKKVKLFSWAGDDTIFQLWKEAGFRPVALAATDILTGLQTGLIDGLPTTPLAALSLQWFRQTDYMMEPGIAPLTGATVISAKAWNQISEADRKQLRESAGRMQQRLMVEIPRKDAEAIEEMKKRGLETVPVESEKLIAEWKEVAAAFAAKMRNGIVPEETFEAALRLRDQFRRAKESEEQTESDP